MRRLPRAAGSSHEIWRASSRRRWKPTISASAPVPARSFLLAALRSAIITNPRGDREIHCPKCGHLNENRPVTCETCDEAVDLKLKYDVDECQERGMTFAVPLKVTIRLVVWDKDAETGAKSNRDIK